jgi:hypothetical protein
MTRPRFADYLLLALVMGLAVVNIMVVRTSNRAPDDSYISLRYADNLAGGEGLVSIRAASESKAFPIRSMC